MSDVQFIANPDASSPMNRRLAQLGSQTHLYPILPQIYDLVTIHKDTLPANFMDIMVGLGIDRLATLYALTQEAIDMTMGRLYWARDVLKRAIEMILVQRRRERGENDHGVISVPHETLQIENKVDFEPYRFDIDVIYEGLRGLPDDEIESLLKIEPERTEYVHALTQNQVSTLVAAIAVLRIEGNTAIAETLKTLLATTTVPESMAVKNTSTLLAWLRKNAGSERAKIVASGVHRRILGVTTTIKPKTIHKRVDPIIPQASIATVEIAS